jgi:hypothetical protein
MKTNRNLFGLLLSSSLLALTAVLPARAQQINIPTDLATVGANATITSTNGVALTLPRDKDIGVLISQAAANTGTSNTVYGFDYQVGTTWTTTAPLRLTLACTGLTNTTGYFFLSKTNFAGVNAARFGYLSTVELTNVTPASITFDWTH